MSDSPLAAVLGVRDRVLHAPAVDVLTAGVAVGNGPAPDSAASITGHGGHKESLRELSRITPLV